jgi:predicted enzyme related to lactoylglutathione lyase
MPGIVHFELCADKPERAIKFYEEVFAWQISKWGGPMEYYLISTHGENEPGINGAIMPRQHPSDATINTIAVPSVDQYAEKVTQAGGVLLTPKQAIPGIGYFAYCKDTEGNTFGIMEADPSAR